MRDIKNEYIIINSDINIYENNEYILLMDYNEVVNNLRDSYNNNNNKIYEQFLRDYNRCKIYINNTKENDNKLFTNYFEILFIINNYNINDLYLFCTQAIMGYCLEQLNDKILDNQYIGELEKKHSLYYFIKCENNKIIINIKKTLRIFYIDNIGNAQTLKIIKIQLYIPLFNKNNIIILYKILKNK
jgi:hypothetical protein